MCVRASACVGLCVWEMVNEKESVSLIEEQFFEVHVCSTSAM